MNYTINLLLDAKVKNTKDLLLLRKRAADAKVRNPDVCFQAVNQIEANLDELNKAIKILSGDLSVTA